MAKEDWSEAKAWMRATRERIGMTQHDAAVLANLTVDMVKKYESEKYRIQPSGRMREMLEHYLAEHRRAVVAIVERHRGDERAVLSFSRVSDLPEGLQPVNLIACFRLFSYDILESCVSGNGRGVRASTSRRYGSGAVRTACPSHLSA